MPEPNTPHRIVIVGGGAGGLPLATSLGDRYGRGSVAQVTLVDRNATHVWKPLLHEVAAVAWTPMRTRSTISRSRIGITSASAKGAIVGLDRARREVMLDAVTGPRARRSCRGERCPTTR
jgi:NADH dehydrogenase